MAKEEIYTIPLWDAVREDSECPFCNIEHKLEQDILDFCLSDAYMDDDFRQITNAKGFCRVHFDQLFHRKNRLGLTLINQTYIKTMRDRFNKAAGVKAGKSSLFGSKEPHPLGQLHHTLTKECYICERIEQTMERYLSTFFYLYKKDDEFVQAVLHSKGFCMPHMTQLMEGCDSALKGKTAASCKSDLMELFNREMDRIEEDMQWFVNKYDYRYENEPWKDAKDAPKRSLQKINGHVFNE